MAGRKHQKSRVLITVLALERNLVPKEKKEVGIQQHSGIIKSWVVLLIQDTQGAFPAVGRGLFAMFRLRVPWAMNCVTSRSHTTGQVRAPRALSLALVTAQPYAEVVALWNRICLHPNSPALSKSETNLVCYWLSSRASFVPAHSLLTKLTCNSGTRLMTNPGTRIPGN